MAAPAVGRLESTPLLPAAEGHVARGRAPPRVSEDAIAPFLPRVAAALARTRADGREHGFLAYAPARAGLPLVAEEDAVGDAHAISWHWRERDATVAFSFHTHPGPDGACMPSGIDVVGAIIRGDHVLYVLTEDGRLSGWRFHDPRGEPRALLEAMMTLDAGGRFDERYLGFMYAACDALRPRLMECVYAATVGEEGATRREWPNRAFVTRRAGRR